MHTETLSAKTCASISNQVFTVFVAELFPTDIRNSALGTGNTFGRLGALCGSLLVNSPVLAHWDLAVLGLTFLGRILYLAFYLRRSHAGQWIIKSQSEEEGEDRC